MSLDSNFGIYPLRLSLVPGTYISPSPCEQNLIKPVWILANFYFLFPIFFLLTRYQHVAYFRPQSPSGEHRLFTLSWTSEFPMHILRSLRVLIFSLFRTYNKGSICPHFSWHQGGRSSQTLISASLWISIGWHSPEYLEHRFFWWTHFEHLL